MEVDADIRLRPNRLPQRREVFFDSSHEGDGLDEPRGPHVKRPRLEGCESFGALLLHRVDGPRVRVDPHPGPGRTAEQLVDGPLQQYLFPEVADARQVGLEVEVRHLGEEVADFGIHQRAVVESTQQAVDVGPRRDVVSHHRQYG